MPPTIGTLGIDPQGQTLVVTITPAAKVYTDAAGTTLASFPQTISTRTQYWFSAAQDFTVSTKSNGVEIAGKNGNVLVIPIAQGTGEWISPTVDRPAEDNLGTNPSYASIGDGASAGANASDQVLKQWTSAEAYELTSITRDANEAITTATVKWPDGSGGTFTTVTASTAFPGAIDAYTISHTLSGKTVTQAAMTRDTAGAVTTKPALTVA